MVLDKEIAHALVFCKEGQRNHCAGVSGVVDGRVAEFSLGMTEIAQAFEIHYATVGRIVKMTDDFWELADLTP